MAHYKVLVIGEDLEQQLEPYSVELEVAPYPAPDWNHDEQVAAARSFFANDPGQHPADMSEEALLRAFHEFEDLRFDAHGRSERWTTENPQAHWDWWEIGGRFAGALKVNEGADAADYETHTGPTKLFGRLFGGKKTSPTLVNRARKRALDLTSSQLSDIYAVVTVGSWHSIDELEAPTTTSYEAEWNQQLRHLIAEAPDLAWLTVVDCHL